MAEQDARGRHTVAGLHAASISRRGCSRLLANLQVIQLSSQEVSTRCGRS